MRCIPAHLVASHHHMLYHPCHLQYCRQFSSLTPAQSASRSCRKSLKSEVVRGDGRDEKRTRNLARSPAPFRTKRATAEASERERETPSSITTMPEPLAADQYSIRFAAEPLPDREAAELVAHGRGEFAKLFSNIRFARESGFGTKVRSSSRSTRAIICVPTQIHATLEEVADVFFSDRTNAAIGFAQSQSIYHALAPSSAHPLRSCGLRWSLWHSPSKLIRQRDICYIEVGDDAGVSRLLD